MWAENYCERSVASSHLFAVQMGRPSRWGAFTRWRRAGPRARRKSPTPSLPRRIGLRSVEGVAPCALAARGQTHTTHHPQPLHPEHPPVFSLRGSDGSPAFLPLLLLLSGDIETNPGPTYPCPTCAAPYSKRLGGIECRQCKSWTHYVKRCSGIPQNHPIPPQQLCRACHPTHTTLPRHSSPNSPNPANTT